MSTQHELTESGGADSSRQPNVSLSDTIGEPDLQLYYEPNTNRILIGPSSDPAQALDIIERFREVLTRLDRDILQSLHDYCGASKAASGITVMFFLPTAEFGREFDEHLLEVLQKLGKTLDAGEVLERGEGVALKAAFTEGPLDWTNPFAHLHSPDSNLAESASVQSKMPRDTVEEVKHQIDTLLAIAQDPAGYVARSLRVIEDRFKGDPVSIADQVARVRDTVTHRVQASQTKPLTGPEQAPIIAPLSVPNPSLEQQQISVGTEYEDAANSSEQTQTQGSESPRIPLQSAIKFFSEEDLETVLTLFWYDPRFRGTARHHVGDFTIIIPFEVANRLIRVLEENKMHFEVQKVELPGESSALEISRLRFNRGVMTALF